MAPVALTFVGKVAGETQIVASKVPVPQHATVRGGVSG